MTEHVFSSVKAERASAETSRVAAVSFRGGQHALNGQFEISLPNEVGHVQDSTDGPQMVAGQLINLTQHYTNISVSCWIAS